MVWRCDCGGIMMPDGILIDTTFNFMGIAYRCVKCGRWVG